jgi:hypothetical protein
MAMSGEAEEAVLLPWAGDGDCGCGAWRRSTSELRGAFAREFAGEHGLDGDDGVIS